MIHRRQLSTTTLSDEDVITYLLMLVSAAHLQDGKKQRSREVEELNQIETQVDQLEHQVTTKAEQVKADLIQQTDTNELNATEELADNLSRQASVWFQSRPDLTTEVNKFETPANGLVRREWILDQPQNVSSEQEKELNGDDLNNNNSGNVNLSRSIHPASIVSSRVGSNSMFDFPIPAELYRSETGDRSTSSTFSPATTAAMATGISFAHSPSSSTTSSREASILSTQLHQSEGRSKHLEKKIRLMMATKKQEHFFFQWNGFSNPKPKPNPKSKGQQISIKRFG
jgi:hypothetical protein